MIRIHYIMHVAFEGLGCIEHWAKEKKHTLSCTRIYANDKFPDQNSFDWLIIMGGPMSVYDPLPWIEKEKKFIQDSILQGKIVIGICLGSQFIASALGSKVYPGKKKEIGFFPITLSEEAFSTAVLPISEREITVFHWHGDTFDLPQGAIKIASTTVTPNQAFLFNKNVLALQFHFEATPFSIQQMIDNGRDELTQSTYIQEEAEIHKGLVHTEKTNQVMYSILNHFEKQANEHTD